MQWSIPLVQWTSCRKDAASNGCDDDDGCLFNALGLCHLVSLTSFMVLLQKMDSLDSSNGFLSPTNCWINLGYLHYNPMKW